MPPTADNGFIDLRIGHGVSGIGDDSVWPSFTDIMMVIVMIFLMALVVMVVRNFELDRQLVTTEISREAGVAENRGLLDTIAVLETQMQGLRQSLDLSQGERDALRTQLLEELKRIERMVADNITLEEQLVTIIAQRNRLSEEKIQLAEQSEERITALTASEADLSRRMGALSTQFDDLKLRTTGEIETLGSANLTLTQQLDEVAAQLEQVKVLLQTEQQQRRDLGLQVEAQDRELSAKQELLTQLQSLQEKSTERYTDARAKIDRLNESINRRQLENSALQKLADASGNRFRSLQEEYDSLDAKYRTLARPARSPAGKYVVDVWIMKSGDEYRFRLKEPAQTAPVDYTKDDLHQRLATLKTKQGRNLYTKIIIPQNSPLSHDEAWRFTQEILQGYDYYHQ